MLSGPFDSLARHVPTRGYVPSFRAFRIFLRARCKGRCVGMRDNRGLRAQRAGLKPLSWSWAKQA